MTGTHSAPTRISRIPAILIAIPCLILLVVAAWAGTTSLGALDKHAAGLRTCDAATVTGCSWEVSGILRYEGSPRKSLESNWRLVDFAGDVWRFDTGPGSGATTGDLVTARVRDGQVLRVLIDGDWVEPLGVGRNRAATMLALVLAALCGAGIFGRHAVSAVRRNRNLSQGSDWKPTKADAVLCMGIVLLVFWGWSLALGLVWWAAPLAGATLFVWMALPFIAELLRKQ